MTSFRWRNDAGAHGRLRRFSDIGYLTIPSLLEVTAFGMPPGRGRVPQDSRWRTSQGMITF